MGRIRTIKPEFWQSESLSSLPEATHLLAAALLNYADDEGYFNANPALVKAACSPLREASVKTPESLRQLAGVGYCQFGLAEDGRRYGKVVNFGDHQRVSHPTPSKIKELQIEWEASHIYTGGLSEDSRNPPETFRPEGKGKEQGKEQGTGKDATRGSREDSAKRTGAVKPSEFDPESIPGLDLLSWYRFVEYRVAIRKPYKPISLPAAARELAAYGADQAAVVEQTIAKGWTGLFELKPAGSGGGRGPRTWSKSADEMEAEERARAS